MRELRYGTKAKKDLEKYRNDLQKLKMLYEVLDMLMRDIPLPSRYQPHILQGNYKGDMEYHVGNDSC